MPNFLNESASQPVNPRSRFAIVVSTYHETVTGNLLEGALKTLEKRGVASANVDVIRVPGAWELALATQEAARTGRYAGIVSLGAVIRGETTHDVYINRFVSQALGRISLEFRIPAGFGLLTCETVAQAEERSGGRSGNKGCEATDAMLDMVQLLEVL